MATSPPFKGALKALMAPKIPTLSDLKPRNLYKDLVVYGFVLDPEKQTHRVTGQSIIINPRDSHRKHLAGIFTPKIFRLVRLVKRLASSPA